MSVIYRRGRAIRIRTIPPLLIRATLAIAAVAMIAGVVTLNAPVIKRIARPARTAPVVFVIAIDTYPLEYGGEAYIVRYTLDGAYHAPDFRRHEDVAVFIEHLKEIANVEGLMDVGVSR